MFVPRCVGAVSWSQLSQLHSFIESSSRLLVLTGAGASTESGIPDYRSEGVGLYARSNHRPVQHQEFVKSPVRRQKYWARNFIGWPHYSAIRPTATHLLLAKWEQEKRVHFLVTQNVDGLHHKAGSQRLIELHGVTRRVGCLNCGHRMQRSDLQSLMLLANRDFDATAIQMRPDGDVELTEEEERRFRVPGCPQCGGALKPDLIFFGDNVPVARKEQVNEIVDESDALLCLGTSLQVYSAYRIILRAIENDIPVAAVSIGETRADHLMRFRISHRVGDVLTEVDRLFT